MNYKGTDWEKRPWTKDELKGLIKDYPNMTGKELAERYKRPRNVLEAVLAEMRKNNISVPHKGGGKTGVMKLIRELASELR